MKQVFAVGFQPYSDLKTNSSQMVVEALGLHPGNLHIRPFVLPLERNSSAEKDLLHALGNEKPDLALVFGSSRRSVIHIEEVFFNRFTAEHARQDTYSLIEETLPSTHTYWCTIDTRALVRALRGYGIPAELSLSPGTFFCNYAAYRIAHAVARTRLSTWFGLIHLPLTSSEVLTNEKYKDGASMPLPVLLEAARFICEKS